MDVLAGTNLVVQTSTLLPASIRSVPPQGAVHSGYLNAAALARTPGFELFAESYSLNSGSIVGPRMVWGPFVSTDGTNWVPRDRGLNNVADFPGIRGLAWGKGRFIVVGEGRTPATSSEGGYITSNNRIWTSINGEDYLAIPSTSISSPLDDEGLTGVAYANGQFVAVGNAGRILNSTNGLNWGTVRASDGLCWNRVRYLDGVWAVVGNAWWVAFSLDGMNWHSCTVGANQTSPTSPARATSS